MKSWLFWPLLGVDCIVALGFLYFFLIGIGDGTVSSFNIVLWLAILGSLGAVLGIGSLLRARGYPVLANCILAVLAVPALPALAFFLVILISHPRWN